jgi:hypothetical protein
VSVDREKLTEDILACLDGQLGEDEERALAARIRGDAEAEKLFADLMRLHGGVASVLAELSGEKAARRELALDPTPPGGVPRGRRRTRFARQRQAPGALIWGLAVGGAIAAVALIAALSTERQRPVRIPERAPIARPADPEPVPAPPPPEPRPQPPPPEPPPAAPQPHEPAPSKPDPEPPKPQAPVPLPPPKPAPAPEPPKPAPAEPVPVRTTPAVARLERVKGDVRILAGDSAAGSKEGQDLLAEQGVSTANAAASALVRFPDGTELDLAGNTRVRHITVEKGKNFTLEEGTLVAQVPRQPAGQPLSVRTPHAELRVLGTRFTVTVSATATRLEVAEGRVRLTRISDGASADVGAGFTATAAAGPRPTARRINPRLLLAEDFEDPAGVDARWTRVEGPLGFRTAGRLELEVKGGPPEGWGGAGLVTRTLFASPFAVAAEVDVSGPHAAWVTAITFQPKSGRPEAAFRVQLRENRYGLLVHTEPPRELKSADRPAGRSGRERWRVELDGNAVRFLVNDREIFQHRHDLPVAEGYRIDLNSAARHDAPQGTRASFDNVVIETLKP